MRKTAKLTVIGLSAFYLSGCVSWFYTPGIGELRELCEKDGGTHIQQVVEVEGYYNDWWENCTGCYTDIIYDGYDYLEINKRELDFGLLGEEMGYWRIYRAKAGDPLCPIRENERIAAMYSKPINEFYAAGNCLAAIKIDQPQSEYGLFSTSEEWIVNDYYKSELIRNVQEVRRFRTQEVIGKFINYQLVPWPQSALDYGIKASCHKVLPRKEMVGTLIKPKVSGNDKGVRND